MNFPCHFDLLLLFKVLYVPKKRTVEMTVPQHPHHSFMSFHKYQPLLASGVLIITPRPTAETLMPMIEMLARLIRCPLCMPFPQIRKGQIIWRFAYIISRYCLYCHNYSDIKFNTHTYPSSWWMGNSRLMVDL